jgi:hypothetical protein
VSRVGVVETARKQSARMDGREVSDGRTCFERVKWTQAPFPSSLEPHRMHQPD